jgi:hypothetical protein
MTRTGLCLAALGVLIASAASAQGPAPAAFRVISPIFGQLVTFSMPANFVVVAVKGRADYYTLQRAERTEAAGKPAIDEAKWLDQLRQLQPIRFCPIVPGEAAPYPSCAVKG